VTGWPRHPGPHQDPVGQGQDLVQLAGHDQDGGAVVALLDDAAVDVLDRSDVDPTCGLRGDDQLGLAGELPGDDQLLLVAARQLADVGARRRCADVVLLDQLVCVAMCVVPVHADAVAVGLGVVAVEHQVLGDVECENQAEPLTVLRDVGDVGIVHRTGRGQGHVDSIELDVTAQRIDEPGERLDQLGLAVALDPGDPNDLARPDLEAHMIDRSVLPFVAHQQLAHR